MNDGKAPTEDPDAEFQFRDDFKRVLLEAMSARMFTLENYETILDQIYSEEGFRPTYGQNDLAQLFHKNLELASGLKNIIACTEKLEDLQKKKRIGKNTYQAHYTRRVNDVTSRP